MKIGILQAGKCPEELQNVHGDYDTMFARILDGQGFTFETYPVVDSLFPPSVDSADGWLITGSKHGVYEDHPWIPPLETFLREAYAADRPIVGVCFGHQILAQALGGTVEKFAGGWSVGATDYDLASGAPPDRIIAWHQDQVITPPAEARVLASSGFCRYAMLAYGTKAFTIQPHPEFSPAFMADLLTVRRSILPAPIAQAAEDSLTLSLTSSRAATQITTFFKTRQIQ
ncbi:MAG: type 1 glutamine amidotransferase [Rhodospirillum sp.]|nr:type 1 glutamine amidotransferase [Rhodospirillum sp.]MCF8489573.1 type 1 glutamine amidotransferase [Rhodospirillum sp.]MCF8501605.1 type 1 glutamine amidotransferase [Rhodospirillum sp.]